MNPEHDDADRGRSVRHENMMNHRFDAHHRVKTGRDSRAKTAPPRTAIGFP